MNGIVVLQSDFGIDSGLVSSMHGVCRTIDPGLVVEDLTHLIPAFNIETASRTLHYTMPCWPTGTTFVSIVDPGVGTARRPCAAKTTNGYYLITPDNGTLTFPYRYFGIEEVREIDTSVHYFSGVEHTDVFHGRDVFAYCAARLACGQISFEEVGPRYPVEDVILFALPECLIEAGYARGVAYSENQNPEDGFGVLMTNIPVKEFRACGFTFGDTVRVRLTDSGGRFVMEGTPLYERSFGYVPQSEPIVYPEVNTFLGLALNKDNFCARYGIAGGEAYKLEIFAH